MLAAHGIEPLTLAPKEGLSLVNGTEPMQALLAFSVRDADLLLRAADVACACPSRRCSAPTGPTTNGSRSSARIPASWTARPTCGPCWPLRS